MLCHVKNCVYCNIIPVYIFTAYKLYLFTAYGPDLGFKSHKSYQDSGLSYVNHMT
jgi:hypothetical protein